MSKRYAHLDTFDCILGRSINSYLFTPEEYKIFMMSNLCIAIEKKKFEFVLIRRCTPLPPLEINEQKNRAQITKSQFFNCFENCFFIRKNY